MQKTPFQNSLPFFTVLKCSSACQLRKTVKYEISDNFSLTWSPKFGWLFQDISYFDSQAFLILYLEHCRIAKYLSIQYQALLTKRNASFGKKYQVCIDCNGIEWGFLRPVTNSCEQIWPCRGHLTLTLGHMGSQGIHSAFLLRLSVHIASHLAYFCLK